MKINEGRFMSAAVRAEGMGVHEDDSFSFLEGLEARTGDSDMQVVRSLLKILEGKDTTNEGEGKLLEAVRFLHEYGNKRASEDIATDGLREWSSDEKNRIKLLVATLEGWFYGEHPINIKAEHFPLLVFLVNRLAKISESQTRDKNENLLVPDYNKEELRGFVGGVDDFLKESLQTEVIDEVDEEIQNSIKEIRNQIQELEVVKKEKVSKTAMDNERNAQSKGQKKKIRKLAEDYYNHEEGNKVGMLKELNGLIDIITMRLETVRRKLSKKTEAKRFSAGSTDVEDLKELIGLINKYKKKICEELVNASSSDHNPSFNVKTALREVIYRYGPRDSYDRDMEDATASHAFEYLKGALPKEVKSKSNPQPESSVKQKKPTIRGVGFGALAEMKIEAKPIDDPNEKSLHSLLFQPPKSAGNLFSTLVDKRDELARETKKLDSLVVKPDISQEDEEKQRLENRLASLSDKRRILERIKTVTTSNFDRSKGHILKDLEEKPGAGLYLLKSILIAWKKSMDLQRAKQSLDVDPHTLIDLALGDRFGHSGRAQVFELTGFMASSSGHESVHYLPEHIAFSLVAAAKLLKDNKQK